MIPNSEVSQLARRHRVSDKTIEKDYVLTWILVQLGESSLKNALIFKGGTAIKKTHFPNYRFSEDLDFTLKEELADQQIRDSLSAIFKNLLERTRIECGLKKMETNDEGSLTLFINYIGPLQARISNRDLKMDITKGELVLDKPEKKQILSDYSDLQKARATILSYTATEILIEKLAAVGSLHRREPRDLYDLDYLFKNIQFDSDILRDHYVKKARHKGLEPSKLLETLEKKLPAYKKLWQVRLEGLAPNLREFNETLRHVKRQIKNCVM